jgi:class 3 adenylate cyclase/tetratricopeptide (TPR) repeat protein
MDIAEWLRRLDMAQYIAAFADNAVDEAVLPSLTADDLKDIGVGPVGHRRKLLNAIASLSDGAASQPPEAMPPATEKAGGAERRQLTTMFCDLVGSTALATRLDPEDLREVIVNYHKAVAEEVVGFGGFVAKYMGDGVLVYFGYPQAQEDDAERAVRTAMALIERIGRLDATITLQARVGIATGIVVVGDLVGSGEAQERGVVGEAPNLAARLQAMAPPCGVLITEATRHLVGDLFEYRDLGTTNLRGFEGAVSVWQVLRPSAVESRFEALRAATLSPLVGREEEIELLLRRWQRAQTGEGQVVLLSGEAGIGKSRLTAALQERLQGELHFRLRYFCSLYRRDSAFHPFIAQIERAAGLEPEDSPETKLSRVEALLARSGTVHSETVALLADLLGFPAPSGYPQVPAAPQRKREATFAALIGQLRTLAPRRPVLIVFEDAHWADSSSLELLDRIVEEAGRLPLFVVITFRPEFAPPWVGPAHVTAISLRRLDQRATTSLVSGITGGKPLPAEVLNRIVERTDGIPLFVEELTKSIVEGWLLLEEDRGYVLSGSLPSVAIPETLHALLMARLDRLPLAKEVAQIGAAIGREFPADLLVAVAQRSEFELTSALEQFVEAGLLFRSGSPPNAYYRFKHVLVQDAAHSTLLRGRRRELHTRIAEVLEQRLAGRPRETRTADDVAALAHHWLVAEEPGRALSYTLEAAKNAERIYARPEAINRYWQVLDLLDRLSASPEHGALRAQTILALDDLPGSLGKGDTRSRMAAHIDTALAEASEAGQMATVAKLEAVRGCRWDDEALLERAVVDGEASGDLSTQATIASFCAGYFGMRGEFEKARGHAARAIAILGVGGQHRERALIMAGQARCFSARSGKFAESARFAQEARLAGDVLSDVGLVAWRAMEAETFMYKGLWAEVVRVAEESLPVAWEIGEWPVVLWASAWLMIAYLKLDRVQDAEHVLERFGVVPALTSAAYALLYRQIALVHLRIATNRARDAVEIARDTAEASRQAKAPLEEGAAFRVLGQAYQANGERADADEAFRSSLEVLERIQCPPELAQTLLAYGLFHRGENQLQYRTMIGRALALFEEMDATGWTEEARAALTTTAPTADSSH